MTARTATGVKGARSRCRLSRGTAGASRSDGKGEAQAAKTAGECTDPEHWDGPTRRSDEGL